MEILTFQFCDLGPAPEQYFDCWGASFHQHYDDSVIGSGPSASDAFNDALNQLAFEGFGTKLLHEAGVEYGFLSGAAHVGVGDIELHCEVEDDEDEPNVYHIGIRFQNPDPDDEVEVL
jgi:hypothetical protein